MIVTLNILQFWIEKKVCVAKRICLSYVMTSLLLWGDNNCNERSVACQHESQPTTDTHWHNFNHYWGFLLLKPGPTAPGGNEGDGMWNDNSKPLKDFHFLLHILCVAAAVKMLNVMKYFLCHKRTDHGNQQQSIKHCVFKLQIHDDLNLLLCSNILTDTFTLRRGCEWEWTFKRDSKSGRNKEASLPYWDTITILTLFSAEWT